MDSHYKTSVKLNFTWNPTTLCIMRGLLALQCFFFVFYQIWICFSQIYHSCLTFTLTSGDFCWLSRQQSLAGPISNTSITGGGKKQNLNRIEFYYLDIYQRKILTRPVYMPDVIPFNLNYLSSGQDEWFGLFYGQRYNYLLDKWEVKFVRAWTVFPPPHTLQSVFNLSFLMTSILLRRTTTYHFSAPLPHRISTLLIGLFQSVPPELQETFFVLRLTHCALVIYTSTPQPLSLSVSFCPIHFDLLVALARCPLLSCESLRTYTFKHTDRRTRAHAKK